MGANPSSDRSMAQSKPIPGESVQILVQPAFTSLAAQLAQGTTGHRSLRAHQIIN